MYQQFDIQTAGCRIGQEVKIRLPKAAKYDRWHPVPKEIEDQVIAFYQEGNSAFQCDKKFGVSAIKILKRRGINLRHRGSYTQKLDPSNYPEVCRLYQDGTSVPKLEGRFGITRTRLYEILELGGIKCRTTKDYRPQSSGKEQEIISVYQSGISAAATGKKFDVCEATVLYVLKNNNIKLRPPGISDGTIARGSRGGISQTPEYARFKKENSPLYKLTCTLRNRILSALKAHGYKKNGRTYFLLGASYKTVMQHIESQFTKGMTWANHGKGKDKWNIDHCVPCASACSEEELLKLFHYTNLSPMWSTDNIKKGSSHNGKKHYYKGGV